jgi:DNA-binding MarR family transcriptional regulator/N-acetylglutamate synthase-like GNAT family acetyltransferase
VTRDAVGRVRSFNRLVTERIGALHETYLARNRPLGASRVLWELTENGSDMRDVRRRLGLDSGYMSRLLRSLEAEGLVSLEPSKSDRRVRLARLTAAGEAERALLDRESDALAASLLAPLQPSQRVDLVRAMGIVERLLTAGLVEITPTDPTSEAAQHCIRSYFADLDGRFETGFDPKLSILADVSELVDPAGALLVARLSQRTIGCGAIKFYEDGPSEVKRMWVDPDARGLGVGRRILTELEDLARGKGVKVLRLETNRSLVEAIGLYRSAGYGEVAAFNDEPYAHHWFEKRLTG